MHCALAQEDREAFNRCYISAVMRTGPPMQCINIPPRKAIEFGIGEFPASGLGARLGMLLRLIGGEGVALARGKGCGTGQRRGV